MSKKATKPKAEASEQVLREETLFEAFAVRFERKDGGITYWREVFQSREEAAKVLNVSMAVACHENRPRKASVVPVRVVAALTAPQPVGVKRSPGPSLIKGMRELLDRLENGTLREVPHPDAPAREGKCGRCGHDISFHQGHAHRIGTREPTYCSLACGCRAFVPDCCTPAKGTPCDTGTSSGTPAAEPVGTSPMTTTSGGPEVSKTDPARGAGEGPYARVEKLDWGTRVILVLSCGMRMEGSHNAEAVCGMLNAAYAAGRASRGTIPPDHQIYNTVTKPDEEGKVYVIFFLAESMEKARFLADKAGLSTDEKELGTLEWMGEKTPDGLLTTWDKEPEAE